MEVGCVYMYGGDVVPSKFLLCDGSAISRTTYYELFSVIGTTYGVGDGSTTFNLPLMEGRVVIGVSGTHALGTTGGTESVTLTEQELPIHSHTIPLHGHASTVKATTPVLSHSITQPAFTYSAPSGNSSCLGGNGYGKSSSVNASRSTNLAISNHASESCTKTGGVNDCSAFDMVSTGGDNSHDNMQPFVAVNYIIYTGVAQ